MNRLARGVRRFRTLAPVSQILIVFLVVAIFAGGVWFFWPRPVPSNVDDISVARVGPSDGTNIPAYVVAAQRSLASLKGATPIVALVSFREYQTGSGAAAVLKGMPLRLAYAHVPIAGAQTRLTSFTAVSGRDLASGVVGLAAERTTTAGDLAAAGDTVGADIARREAAAYRGGCACVYGVVVVAAPDSLRALAGRSEVRAVEAAAEIRDPYSTVFRPLLPEDSGVVGVG
ncbi:hypothetical protein [Fodinicola acaciae]|uniref:hypothetical protein n=1 Tax=Fodinicola acaciae TaxID=2681555 RepID=UPI0013D0BA1F|nr:hypothetical protein [Fodinicola acaciae]